MKWFALFILMMGALLCTTGIEKACSQEQGEKAESELTDQEGKNSLPSTTRKPVLPVQEREINRPEKKTDAPDKKAAQARGDVKEDTLDEKEKAEIEDLKSRFRKLVEDEMEKFGALEEAEPAEDLKKQPAEKKKTAVTQEEVKREEKQKRQEETLPETQMSAEELEEELEEKKMLQMLDEETPEGVTGIMPPEPKQPAEGPQKIALDFQDADIKEVITALAEIVGINYIIDPKVRGTVNIHTSGEIPVEGVLPILETIFEINNVAAVKVGDIYKIIPIKDAQKQPLIPQLEITPEDPTSSDRIVLQIVPLRFVASQEMEKILKRFLGKGGDIVNFAARNILIIVDTAANMQKLLTLIDTIDLSIFDTMHVKFYELEDSEAKDLAKELEDLFNALGLDTKKKKGGGGEVVRFIPIERLNIILAVSSMPDIFEKVSEWIEKLDGVREELEEQIFIYFVENAKAIDIGDIIKELYGDKKKERETKQPTRTSRTQQRPKRRLKRRPPKQVLQPQPERSRLWWMKSTMPSSCGRLPRTTPRY